MEQVLKHKNVTVFQALWVNLYGYPTAVYIDIKIVLNQNAMYLLQQYQIPHLIVPDTLPQHMYGLQQKDSGLKLMCEALS